MILLILLSFTSAIFQTRPISGETYVGTSVVRKGIALSFSRIVVIASWVSTEVGTEVGAAASEFKHRPRTESRVLNEKKTNKMVGFFQHFTVCFFSTATKDDAITQLI